MTDPIRTVAIAGGKGRMGRLIGERCQKAGIEALCLGRPYSPDTLRGVERAEALILSVPVPAVEETLALVAPSLSPECIVADVCSVKVEPVRRMEAGWNGPVVGTHPLFGGVIPEGFNPRVAVCRSRGEEAAKRISRFMEELGFSPFSTTCDEHDRAAAMVQGLNFTTTVAYLAAMRREPGIENFVTPSFVRRLEAAKKMLTEDKELFVTIADANPHSLEAVRAFRNYLQIAAGGDLDLLAEMAGEWWDGESTTQG